MDATLRHLTTMSKIMRHYIVIGGPPDFRLFAGEHTYIKPKTEIQLGLLR